MSEKTSPPRDIEKALLSEYDADEHEAVILNQQWARWRELRQQSWPSRASIDNIFWVAVNTVSTVMLVFANKIIFSDSQMQHCQIFTAAWHFTATTLVLMISTTGPFKLFERVYIPLRQILPMSLFFVGFLVLGNLSLALNPVSFYQIAKIMTTPCVVLINFVLWRKTVSREVMLAIGICCLGVGLTNSSVGLSNPLGTMVAVAAFTVTAFYQIWIGKKVADLNVSPAQLLFNQAPVSVVMLLLLMPWTDTMPDLPAVSPRIWATFAVSGLLASMLNLSQFKIIGATSALTFNIVSNAKNIIIISLGWYQAGKTLGATDILGVVFALGGVALYSVYANPARKN